ncbi:hypothetical protein NL676_010165 [Syzygium grande]|nr:hypothetical protein NL676_010165 [Syzygium grande]
MAATNCPDSTAVSARGGEFDFDLTGVRLQEIVDHAAELLAAYGIGPGDVVALAFPYTVKVFCDPFSGGHPLSSCSGSAQPAYNAMEFEYHLSDLRSKLLLTPNEGNRLAQFAASELNIPHLTTRLHSANSKITLSSTDIEPDLDSMSKVVNDPSDVALYLCDSGIPRYKFLGVALCFRNRYIPAFCRRVQFTQKELAIAVEYTFLQDRHLVLAFLSSLAVGTTAAARSSTWRFLDKMISRNATRHTAVVGPGVRYRPEVARPDMPEGNNAPTTTDENKTETESGGEEPTLTEELANLVSPSSDFVPSSIQSRLASADPVDSFPVISDGEGTYAHRPVEEGGFEFPQEDSHLRPRGEVRVPPDACAAAVARRLLAPLNPAYKAETFERYLSNSQSKLLLTPHEGNQPAQSAASKLNIPHLTAKLHSADSKISLSSTGIVPDLDSMSKVVNDPSDVALFLRYDFGPSLSTAMRFTQKELAAEVLSDNSHMLNYLQIYPAVSEHPLIRYECLVRELLRYLVAGTPVALLAATAAARSSGNARRHTANKVDRVRYTSEVARPAKIEASLNSKKQETRVIRPRPIRRGLLPTPVLVKSELMEVHGGRASMGCAGAVGLARNDAAEVSRCRQSDRLNQKSLFCSVCSVSRFLFCFSSNVRIEIIDLIISYGKNGLLKMGS